jgi:TolB protein
MRCSSCNVYWSPFVILQNIRMKRSFFLLLVILSSCRKDAAVDMSPINATGEILFISRRISNSADWQMFLMNTDGSNQHTISNRLVNCSPPVLSNSGLKIAFTTYENFYYHLYVIDKDGQNEKLLVTSKQFCGSPSWSPDDRKIVFLKNDNLSSHDYHIYIIDATGGNELKLTNQSTNFSPKYFSNNTIIFSSASDYNSWSGIYKINTDGSNKQLLTPTGKSFGSPQVSPDGNKILITSNDWNGSQIFLMNANGSGLKQLTFTVSPKWIDRGYPRDGNYGPVWSPDSEKLAYVSYENGSPDIFIMNANGTGNKRLTDTPLRDESPIWAKDGKHILFSSNRKIDVSSEIYIMKSEGQLQTPLTGYVADDIYPVFISK